MAAKPLEDKWALILGASSGFGAEIAKYLSEQGLNIVGVHLDRRETIPNVNKVKREIEKNKRKALFFNVNAADADKRKMVLNEVERVLKPEKEGIQSFIHSLAFGTLKPFIGKDAIKPNQMAMTMEVMAHSLLWWVQDLFERGLLKQGSRIFAMTSAGSHTVLETYGAVSSAKAALESHIRQLAFELAPYEITANTVQAGITDTPSLRKISVHKDMIKWTKLKNPHHRMTTPRDIAKVIYVLSLPETQWITGDVIRADGGEDIIG